MEPKLEGLLCLTGQDLDVAIVDELQHSTEQPAHLCLTLFTCYCFKAHWYSTFLPYTQAEP
ncbi:MAG: hypothetical protein FRX49_01906 [Trebouxia sp. A1-2]|nr:MAG: hypothetical protein FRX49_01906 [Trebouxia sp. A1-2]